MQEKRTLYLAGKITGDPYYFTKFYNAQKKLEEGGFIVVNPALLPAEGFTWEAYAGEVEEGGTRRRFHYLFRHVRRDIGAEDHNGKQSARESGRENLFRRKPCFLRLFPRSHRQRAFRKARRDYLRRNGCRGGERR